MPLAQIMVEPLEMRTKLSQYKPRLHPAKALLEDKVNKLRSHLVVRASKIRALSVGGTLNRIRDLAAVLAKRATASLLANTLHKGTAGSETIANSVMTQGMLHQVPQEEVLGQHHNQALSVVRQAAAFLRRHPFQQAHSELVPRLVRSALDRMPRRLSAMLPPHPTHLPSRVTLPSRQVFLPRISLLSPRINLQHNSLHLAHLLATILLRLGEKPGIPRLLVRRPPRIPPRSVEVAIPPLLRLVEVQMQLLLRLVEVLMPLLHPLVVVRIRRPHLLVAVLIQRLHLLVAVLMQPLHLLEVAAVQHHHRFQIRTSLPSVKCLNRLALVAVIPIPRRSEGVPRPHQARSQVEARLLVQATRLNRSGPQPIQIHPHFREMQMRTHLLSVVTRPLAALQGLEETIKGLVETTKGLAETRAAVSHLVSTSLKAGAEMELTADLVTIPMLETIAEDLEETTVDLELPPVVDSELHPAVDSGETLTALSEEGAALALVAAEEDLDKALLSVGLDDRDARNVMPAIKNKNYCSHPSSNRV